MGSEHKPKDSKSEKVPRPTWPTKTITWELDLGLGGAKQKEKGILCNLKSNLGKLPVEPLYREFCQLRFFDF